MNNYSIEMTEKWKLKKLKNPKTLILVHMSFSIVFVCFCDIPIPSTNCQLPTHSQLCPAENFSAPSCHPSHFKFFLLSDIRGWCLLTFLTNDQLFGLELSQFSNLIFFFSHRNRASMIYRGI